MNHIPVLLHETLYYLDPQPGKLIIDGTMNGGGHTAEIASRVSPRGSVIGIDWDEEIIERARDRFAKSENIVVIQGNYADLLEIMKKRGVPKAQGLLLDLGFSSAQIGPSGKGFSFLHDEPLIMTYSESLVPVWKIIKEMREKELADTIFKLGGEKFSRRIAKAIKAYPKPIVRTGTLADVIHSAVPKNYERGRIDPATRTFQALRIFANHELENLEKALSDLPEILAPGGRAVVISFHSLEDRIVKNAFRDMGKKKLLSILTKKPVEASDAEVRWNPRSRSAKLRAAEIPM